MPARCAAAHGAGGARPLPGLPVTPEKWKPGTPVAGNLNDEGAITATRLWSIFKWFFATAAIVVGERSPATADKLRRATPHWMRHTHATHALDGGAELKSVRDNLRHASIATTSVSARRQCAAGEAGGRGVRRASEVVRSPAGLATPDLASRCTTRCAGHCRDAWMTEFSGHWSAQKRTNLHKQYDPTF